MVEWHTTAHLVGMRRNTMPVAVLAHIQYQLFLSVTGHQSLATGTQQA